MRINHVKATLRAGRPALGTLCTTASPLMAEAFGHAGFDFLIVDMQHGETNLGSLQAMLQAASATPTIPLVRVPVNSAVYIQRALDLGAYGIVAPLIDSADDARALLQSVHYAPRGARSWGPVRGSLYGGSDYFDASADQLLTIVMLETRAGFADAGAILDVPGIDGCFIGPNDLSIALGFRPEASELAAPVEDAIATIAACAAAAGKVAGIQVYSADDARRRIGQGFRFVSVQSDLRMARSTATQLIGAVRRAPSAA
jgi:4-hydroxy-2-oxoheptanedioate aldolase